MNRRIRNRMYGGVGGRRVRALLLPDSQNRIFQAFGLTLDSKIRYGFIYP